MISALVTTTLLWAAGLALYYALSRAVPAHGFNRAYLLAVSFGGAVVPWLPSPEVAEAILPIAPATSVVWLTQVTVGAEAAATGLTARLLACGYGLGLFAALAFLVDDVVRVVRCFGESRPVLGTRAGGLRVRELARAPGPFSFARTLFVRNWSALDADVREGIVRHEAAHWRLGHRFDNISVAVLCAVAWFHPLVYVLRRELRLVHEFQADRAALATTAPEPYRRLLLAARLQTSPSHLATALGHEPLKARFDMMTKRFSPRQLWRLATAALLMAAATVACTKEEIDEDTLAELSAAQGDALSAEDRFMMGLSGAHREVSADTIVVFDPETGTETVDVVHRITDAEGADVGTFRERVGGHETGVQMVVRGQRVYSIVEDMPHFTGLGCAEADRDCNERAMLEYVYSRVQYPEIARESQIQGKVIAQFVVGTDGAILEPTIVRSPHEAFSAEVLRILEEMPEWRPGRQGDELVQTRFVLPVQFQLE